MLNDRELSAAIGSTAYAPDGDTIGTVEHFFVDDRTGAPTWVAVSTGLFGTRHSIVPAVDATFAEGALRLPVTKDAVKSAPHIAETQHLDPGEEEELRRHYGLGTAATESGAPRPSAAPAAPPTVEIPTAQVPAAQPSAAEPPAAPTPAAATPAPQPSDGSMTRSEERLRVHTEQVAATRVRLVKYVVTEEVQLTVPIRREEIRIEEVPLDAPDAGPGESLVDVGPGDAGRHAATGTADTGGTAGLPEEIVLHREEPVVSVRVVPAERVRLSTQLVQGQEQVGAQLQREQIAVDEQPVVARPEGGAPTGVRTP
jgi:stress response protein YsnF